jgi:hypothetical protein
MNTFRPEVFQRLVATFIEAVIFTSVGDESRVIITTSGVARSASVLLRGVLSFAQRPLEEAAMVDLIHCALVPSSFTEWPTGCDPGVARQGLFDDLYWLKISGPSEIQVVANSIELMWTE